MKNAGDGKTTEENGALLRYINHQWFNRLPKEQQAKINQLFQEYKRKHSKECTVEFVDYLPLDWEVKAMVFTAEELQPKKKYNRAEDKRNVQKKIREWEEER